MNQPRAMMLAARLDRGGVADHARLLSSELSALGVPTVAVTPESITHPPAWIGLHFVCYAWARRGILRRNDIARVKSLCAGSRVAVYLHELWIGESVAEPFKHRIIGLLQKRGVTRLLCEIAPAKLFTSTPVYQAMLKTAGFEAEVLPLPGNIPPANAAEMQSAREWLGQHDIQPGTNIALAAVFGTIHPEWRPVEALREWTKACRAHGRQPILLTIGRHGPAGEANLSHLQAAIAGLSILSAGEQSPALVAGLLACCDFGWATSPWALIGKSGSAAAFLESGLPVVVTRNDWRWRRGDTPAPQGHPQLHLWTPGEGAFWSENRLKRTAPASRLRPTALAWMTLFNGGDRA